LAGFKCPKVIHIVDEIPRTATGKVQRRIVSAAFA
jgi:acyl-coenzyme A synthetase/AMP-(fatty) acid ligase